MGGITMPGVNQLPMGGSNGSSRLPPFRVVRAYFRMPPEPGGMEAHIARLSAEQRVLGIEVLNLYNTGEAEGASVRVFSGCDLLAVRPAALRNAAFYLGSLALSERLSGSLATVLHVHGDWSDFLFSKALARAIDAKVVAASLHGAVKKRYASLYRLGLSHCSLIFATGKGDQVYLQELLRRTVHHLPSAPLDCFFDVQSVEAHTDCDVVSVANFFPNKRLDIVIECAARRPDLHFAIYGDGPDWEKIVAQVVARNITNVVLPGRRAPAQILSALQSSKLFLSTAEQEGTPTSVLEAMAAGLPVVLTPSNEYGWLVQNGVNGFITQGWEVGEILERIDDVLTDESRRGAMGRANHDRALKHTWRANAELVNKLMLEKLRQNGET